MIAIVDYGMGNLHSVAKAMRRAGYQALVTDDPAEVLAARGVILPGVGAYADAMAALRRRGLDGALRQVVEADRPFLGICLGLQLLFESSEENGGAEGLGLLPGRVLRFAEQPGLKVPHMGWNRLDLRRPSPLWAGLPEQFHVYFVHSYYVQPGRWSLVTATTPYGLDVPAAVSRGNCHGVQFHPEKSSAVGLRILSNFGRLADAAQPEERLA